MTALEAHVETLKGENETLKGQLAAAEARAEKEAENAGKAIAAFSALADRLDALTQTAPIPAPAHRPWWLRLTSRA